MATLTELNHPGEAIVSEANGCRSRESITVLSGENVKSAEVVALVTKAGASAVADGANTGNGIMGAITVGAGSKVGDYVLTFLEAIGNAGAFDVEDPDGISVDSGDAGTAFSAGGLAFTLADGATDFLAGDRFVITVAAGSLKYVALDENGTDGSETAAGVMYAAVDASLADALGVIIARDAELDSTALVWPSTINAGEKTAAIAQLATLGLIVR